jgi:hypothetical protein
MHHIDVQKVPGGKWLAVVDALGNWSINFIIWSKSWFTKKIAAIKGSFLTKFWFDFD